jgi:DNA-binding response OmpR family regulator
MEKMRDKKSQRSMTVLVIDDDDRVRTLLRDILLFGGYEVIEAPDGESGIRYLEKDGSVDMVLTDLGMPLKNGWEVAKWIKTKTPQIPVVLITGWGTSLDEGKIRDSGVDMIIGKPFQVNEILEAVHFFLKVS